MVKLPSHYTDLRRRILRFFDDEPDLQVDATNISNSLVKVVLSFSSAITPDSILHQSIPASYLARYVQGPSDVAVYADINGNWCGL